MDKLYLHAGTHKTGSTALQQFLNMNRTWLASQDICYPEPSGYSHSSSAQALRKNNPLPLQANLDEIRNSGKRVGLLSAEDFRYHPERIKDALKEDAGKLTVILYLRRQDDYLDSTYKERVKSPKRQETSTFDEYVKKYLTEEEPLQSKIDWYSMLQKWSNYFSKDQIVVRVYESDQFVGGNLFTDFLNTLGLEQSPSLTYPGVTDSNPSLSPYLTEFLRRTNAQRSQEEQATLIDLLQKVQPEIMARIPNVPQHFISPKQRISLLKRYHSSNQKVAQEFLGIQDGTLFQHPWPDPEGPFTPPGLGMGEVLPICMRLFLEEYQMLRHLEHSVNHLMHGTDETDLRHVLRDAPHPSDFRMWISSKCLKNSGNFDPDFYLKENPDVRESGTDPIIHFVTNGWKEGRDPNPNLNLLNYLQQHPKRIISGWNPLLFISEKGWSRVVALLLRVRFR